MDEKERQAIIETKDKWLIAGNIGGAAACSFLIIKDSELDIVYDAENELVREYCELLRKQLETDNDRLLLMVSTEIERCLMNEKEELYGYLSDEIYEHFQSGGGKYPIQAVWLHIHVIYTLFQLNYEEEGGRYMRIIRDTQKEVFGDESFLFCRNWCYIVNEPLLKYIPDAAIIEFDSNMDLFSKILKEEDILYQLCINIGIAKTKQEQNADFLKQAVYLCEMWCGDISIELQKPKQALIRIMRAMSYRNTGELDTAMKMFQEEMHLTESIQCKLYLIGQIASILFTKRDLSMFPAILEEGEKLITDGQESDEHVAGFYNICGLYYMMKGQYAKAIPQFDRAISISEKVMDKNADEIVKLKYCRLMAEYEMGNINEVSKQIDRLFRTTCNNIEYYSQSLPLIINGMIMLGLKNNINSDTVKRMKDMLNINQNKYDMISVISFKSSLYYLMMASEDIYDRNDWESMQEELEKFFYRYPYAEGMLQYLEGEYYRCLKENDSSSVNEAVGRILDKIEKYCANNSYIVTSMSYFHYYYVKLRKLLYRKDYIAATRQLLSMRKNIIMPLFETLSHMEKDMSEDIYYIINSYASLFISTIQQYPQLHISKKLLYEFVLNIKYFENLFYCRKQEFYSAVEHKKWLSENDINISRKDLIIESFDYIRNDMKDLWSTFRVSEQEPYSLIYRIYFGIQFSTGIFPKRSVEVISDVPVKELHKKISDLYLTYDMKKVSEIEKTICNKLDRFLYKKNKIFYCYSNLDILMPLAFIRMNDGQYLGETYQIIYCNIAKDIKSDANIQDISNSIFFGMSKFDGNKKSQEIKKRLDDLPYVELEVEVLGELTGGVVCLNEKKPKEWFDGQSAEVIHFATHTLKDKENGSISLIIEKDNTGLYKFLQDKDISEMNWKKVKLAVFSGCETALEEWKELGKQSLRLAAKRAGTLFSISTWTEINDGAGSFFMVCFYKNLLRYGKICDAFFETQKMMRSMTKKEILNDDDYIKIGMELYLQNMEEDSKPFGQSDDWALYLLQMN